MEVLERAQSPSIESMKWFKAQLKHQLHVAGLEAKTWESTAADNNTWPSAVYNAALKLSNIKKKAAMHKRASPNEVQPDLQCSHIRPGVQVHKLPKNLPVKDWPLKL